MRRTTYRVLHERAQFLNQLGRDLERIADRQDSTRVIRFAGRRFGEFIGADLVAQIDVSRTGGALGRPLATPLTVRGGELIPSLGESGSLEAISAFLRRPVGPADHARLLLRVISGDRPVSVLALLRPGRNFSREETRLGIEAMEILSENLRHRERERVQAQKERIYAKILSELRPKDVLYQILHGLKRILEYDHSGTVLLLESEGTELVVEAEIITWTKAKSERIGRNIPVTEDLGSWLESCSHPVLVHAGEEEIAGRPLPRALGTAVFDPENATARAGLVGVLCHRDRVLGILALRARGAAAFTSSDLQILSEFLPLASITLYNSTLYKKQQDRLISAERRTALADLARAISHDLNNAFGVMLPLLEAARRDVAAGTAQTPRLASDLDMIERYAQAGSRIFQGLLAVARGAAEPAAWTDLTAVLESVSRMIGPSLGGKRIEIRTGFQAGLPRVYLRRSDMEQLFLNLIYNARDAMPKGGTLTLRCLPDPENAGVRVEISDTGTGMSEEVRARVFEPFFTTKETGSGLGLDICRSIVWDYDGSIQLESAPGHGTTVTVRIPCLAERLREKAAHTPLEEAHGG